VHLPVILACHAGLLFWCGAMTS